MKTTPYIKTILLFCLLAAAKTSSTATITSTSTGGSWSSGSTWIGGTAPGSSDNAIIATTGGNAVTVSGAVTITSFTVNTNASLTINSGIAITMNLIGSALNNGTINGSGNILQTAANSITNNGAMTMSRLSVILGSFSNNGTITTGTLSVSTGSFTNYGTTTVQSSLSLSLGTITNRTNSTLNFGGSAFTISISTVDFNTYSGNTVDYYGTNQNIYNTTYRNLKLSGSGNKSSTNNLTVNENFFILGTASLNLDSGNDNLTVKGNWDNSSTNADPLDDDGQTITWSGTTQQTVTNTGDAQGTEFYNLIINNSFGTSPQIQLNTTVTIRNALTLTRGIIATTSTNILVINDNATSSSGAGGANPSYVDGPMKKIGNDAFTFPVGDNGTWARISMENTLTNYETTTEFTAEYIRSAAPYPSSLGNGLNHVSYNEYWDLSRFSDPGNNASCNVRLYWEDETTSNIQNMSDLRVAHFQSSAGQWENQGGTGTDLGTSGYITSTTPLSSFSPVAFGSAGGFNSLPIKLISLHAVRSQNRVELSWVTATEINNDYFTIEKSGNGIDFETVLVKRGAGNSLEKQLYTGIDNFPFEGISYYRLKQTDFDGRFTYSSLVSVNALPAEQFTVSPNPANLQSNPILNIAGLESDKEVLVLVYDMKGNEIFLTVLLTDANGMGSFATDLSGNLAPGVYFIAASTNGKILNQKMIIQ